MDAKVSASTNETPQEIKAEEIPSTGAAESVPAISETHPTPAAAESDTVKYVAAPAEHQPAIVTAAILGITTGMTGGALIVLGWLLPWFHVNLFGQVIGVGNGLQFFLLWLIIGLLLLTVAWPLGLLALLAAIVQIIPPIAGIAAFWKAVRIFEVKSAVDEAERTKIKQLLRQLRNIAVIAFIPVFLEFCLAALTPFNEYLFQGGFFVLFVGVVVTFFGALFAMSKAKEQK